MFCPECGYKLNEGERFCSGCGADMNALLGETSVQQTQPTQPRPVQQYTQPVQQAQPVQQYTQPVQAQPAQQYSQPVQQYTQPVQQYTQPVQQYGQPVQAVPKKKKSKAPLIAVGAGAAAVVLIGGGIAGVIAYQGFAAQKYVKENPTKAVANSYTTYLSERKDTGTAGLFTLLGNVKDKGTVKLTYNYQYDYKGNNSSGTSAVTYSYDKNAKQFYIRADSDDLGALVSRGSSEQQDKKNSTLELFTDSKIVNLRYDIEKTQGSYYLDAEHFRDSISNSVFAPSKENLANMTDEQFEDLISSFEKFYDNVTKDLDRKEEEYTDKLVAIIEKNGSPVVTEETIEVRGKNRDVYTVTYTFDRAALIATVNDLKKFAVDTFEENAADLEGIEEAKTSIEEGFEDITEKLREANDKLEIVLKSSLDRGSGQAARLGLTATGISDDGTTLDAFIEFGSDAELDIYAELVITGEDGGKATLTIKSAKSGSKTTYSADLYSKGTKEEKANTAGVSLVYDDSAKTYSLNYSVNGEEKTALEGKADISENKASFTFEQAMKTYDYSLAENTDSINLSDMEVEMGKYTVTIDISGDTNIVSFKGDKDIMSLTREEFEALEESFGGSSGYAYEYPEDYDYDYFDDDDYDDIDFNDGGDYSNVSYITAAKGLVGLFSANVRG